MFTKRKKSAISVLLAFVLVFTAFFSMAAPAAQAVTQSQIDALQAQRDQLKQQQSGLQNTISNLKSQQNSLVELKTALDEKNTLTLQQIQNLEEQIDLHKELIAQKTEEIDEAQKVADEQLRRYKVRLRNMEENGRFGYIEVLFGAGSIGEFLSLIDDIGDIMKSDKELEEAYRQAVQDLKTLKAEYEEAKKELEARNDELKTLSAQLEADIAEASALIASLQNDINANASQLSAIAAQRNEADAELAAMRKELAKQQEEERRQQQQQSGGSGGTVIATGSLMWPSYCTTVSSPYGYRIHPIYGTYKMHGGVDISASYGTAIWAADSGKVVTSQDGWNGGWGNYIIIDHGNGVQTLYAHQSSRAVSVGQTVSKGQVIGYVGSTGASTGPHLHFEVWNNGNRVDPMSYFR
ncbi:MAG: peptidoglycan DD-metalloendopeptidase family protein [Oscillospiraceae bacterium]|nr:peptidoglycan DD-metalloendopeptidase family protein [Oscillospiraceae bacterium]